MTPNGLTPLILFRDAGAWTAIVSWPETGGHPPMSGTGSRPLSLVRQLPRALVTVEVPGSPEIWDRTRIPA